MKKSVLVTGVPGTGKTTISQRLNELGYKAYDLDDGLGLYSMIHKITKLPIVDHNNTDLEKVKNLNWVCDKEKLASIIKNEINDLVFYCGNASNWREIISLFDLIVLLKISPEIMKKRLTSRTNNDYGRNSEVQDYLLTKKDLWDSELENTGAISVDANGDLDSVVKEIIMKTK